MAIYSWNRYDERKVFRIISLSFYQFQSKNKFHVATCHSLEVGIPTSPSTYHSVVQDCSCSTSAVNNCKELPAIKLALYS